MLMSSLASSYEPESVNWKFSELCLTIGVIEHYIYLLVIVSHTSGALCSNELIRLWKRMCSVQNVGIEKRRFLRRRLAVSTCSRSGNHTTVNLCIHFQKFKFGNLY
jgi:hypothetical protein